MSLKEAAAVADAILNPEDAKAEELPAAKSQLDDEKKETKPPKKKRKSRKGKAKTAKEKREAKAKQAEKEEQLQREADQAEAAAQAERAAASQQLDFQLPEGYPVPRPEHIAAAMAATKMYDQFLARRFGRGLDAEEGKAIIASGAIVAAKYMDVIEPEYIFAGALLLPYLERRADTIGEE